MKSITVIGKRWFQKTYGNTYCSAQVLVDGKTAFIVPNQYGYGDYYLQRAGELLEEKGMLPGIEKYKWGGTEPLWQYCNRKNINFEYFVSDVERRRDLDSEAI